MNVTERTVAELATDFGKASMGLARALYVVYREAGEGFAADWRHNTTATAGAHGKHYPKSITTETTVGRDIHVETGPDPRFRQGRMGRGFEFGSRNQPPHLDGARALPLAEKRLERAVDAVFAFLIP